MIAGIPQAGSFAALRVTWVRLFYLIATLASAIAAAALDSELAPLASRSLLLDVARAGPQLVAVGDRGHILLSSNEGGTWRQVIVPTRAMLTGVAFGDNLHGWAVGHDGAILATTDGGQSWYKQEAGTDLETVFLDVQFLDSISGFAVGAYGKCLFTADGGKNWKPASPSANEVHFNQMAAGPDGTLYLTGENGMLLASGDQGATWRKLAVPYDGSLFGLLPLDARTLLVYGLRGHVFISDDAGATWSPREIPVPVLIMAGVHLKAGPIILAGLGGNFFISRDGARTFQSWKPAEFTGGVAGLLETHDGALLAVGESGVARLQVPEATRP